MAELRLVRRAQSLSCHSESRHTVESLIDSKAEPSGVGGFPKRELGHNMSSSQFPDASSNLFLASPPTDKSQVRDKISWVFIR